MNDQSISAYVMAIVIALVVLLIAAAISIIIPFEGGSNPQDPKKRKRVFWIFAILNPIIIFLAGFLIVRPGIDIPALIDQYTTALGIGTGIGVVVYLLLGFIMSKANKNGKLGHWF